MEQQLAARHTNGASPVALYPTQLVTDTIRLLTITPGGSNVPIHTTLAVWDLGSESMPAYHALSYVWGDTDDTVTISCNGSAIHITKNLHWALTRVRHKRKVVVVWADALCINQADKTELSAQVLLMGKIYASASKVFVCLGKLAPSDSWMDRYRLRKLVRLLNRAEEKDDRDPRRWSPSLRTPRSASLWLHVFYIHQTRWFGRVWVVQEASIAENPRVLYGPYEFSYQLFMNVTLWLGLRVGQFTLNCGSAIHMIWWTWKPESATDKSFLDLLFHARHLSCKDPRDYVYAFLGHPSAQNGDGSGPVIVPDYKKDIASIFREFSYFLASQRDIRLFGCIKHTESTLNEDSPSWILRHEWWEGNEASFSLPGFMVTSTRPWKASQGLEMQTLQLQGDTLEIGSVLIDTVRYVFDVEVNLEEGKIEFQDLQGVKTSATNLMNMLAGLPFVYEGSVMTIGSDSAGRRPVDRLHNFLYTLTGGFMQWDMLTQAVEENVLEDLEAAVQQEKRDTTQHAQGYYAQVGQSPRPSFLRNVRKACRGRRFALTDLGYYALVPNVTLPDDLLCVLQDFGVPGILRSSNQNTTTKNCYQFLGEAWENGTCSGLVTTLSQRGLVLGEEVVCLR